MVCNSTQPIPHQNKSAGSKKTPEVKRAKNEEEEGVKHTAINPLVGHDDQCEDQDVGEEDKEDHVVKMRPRKPVFF